MRHITMTVDEWNTVPANPVQRDTERHAQRALRGHLREASEPQATVFAANVRGTGLVKLDGHTRGFLWSKGTLAPPPAIDVVIYDVESMNEAVELYYQFDGTGPVDTAQDNVYGAYRFNSITPQSDLLVRGGVVSAFRVLLGRNLHPGELLTLVGDFRREFRLLDAANLDRKQMAVPVFAGALITTYRYGNRAIEFFRRYCHDEGAKVGEVRDAIEALRHVIDVRRSRKQMSSAHHPEVAGITINAVEKFMKGEELRTTLRAIDLRAYIDRTLTDRTEHGATQPEHPLLRESSSVYDVFSEL